MDVLLALLGGDDNLVQNGGLFSCQSVALFRSFLDVLGRLLSERGSAKDDENQSESDCD